MDLSTLIKQGKEIRKNLDAIRTKEDGVVMFVDLANSTEYKSDHPAEEDWLVRLAEFLSSVTSIVSERGRVVKYIGDEVMAYFDGKAGVLHAQQAAEQILHFCAEERSEPFEVKIGLDYGPVSMIDFVKSQKSLPKDHFGKRDPNGVTVDRCARIMSKSVAGAVLCSAFFRDQCNDKKRWISVGKFKARGIKDLVKVYQLSWEGAPTVQIESEQMTIADCTKALGKVRRQLEATKQLRRLPK